MVNLSYPEQFSTINFIRHNNYWIVGAGLLLLFLFLIIYRLPKKHNDNLLKAIGINYYWLVVLAIWSFLSLGDVFAWSNDLVVNKAVLGKRVEERQGERLCQIIYNTYGMRHCPYLSLYLSLDKVTLGSKIYVPDSFVATRFYLRYFLAGKYVLVDSPNKADYLLLISSLYDHNYENEELSEFRDGQWLSLGHFLIINNTGGVILFSNKK